MDREDGAVDQGYSATGDPPAIVRITTVCSALIRNMCRVLALCPVMSGHHARAMHANEARPSMNLDSTHREAAVEPGTPTDRGRVTCRGVSLAHSTVLSIHSTAPLHGRVSLQVNLCRASTSAHDWPVLSRA